MKENNRVKRLQRRVASWQAFVNKVLFDEGPEKRRKSGGYKCPGSRKR